MKLGCVEALRLLLKYDLPIESSTSASAPSPVRLSPRPLSSLKQKLSIKNLVTKNTIKTTIININAMVQWCGSFLYLHGRMRPVSDVVSHVGGDWRWCSQTAVLWFPVFHWINSGVSWPPHNDCYHQQEDQGSKKCYHACQRKIIKSHENKIQMGMIIKDMHYQDVILFD